MSAQMHRERKKAYITYLENIVRHREAKIIALNDQIVQLTKQQSITNFNNHVSLSPLLLPPPPLSSTSGVSSASSWTSSEEELSDDASCKSASTDGSKKSAPGKPSKKVADNKPAPAKKKDSSANVITGPAQNEEDNTEDAPVGKDAISTVNGAKPDYAQTMTENYKNLNNMLEPESIQNLTKETMALMSEQKKLFESMQSMSPLLAQAKDMLAGMDMNNLQGLGDMVKNFAAAKP
jgi:hypothetical protein